MAFEYTQTSVPRTCEYLESLGIDPGSVAGDESFTTKSYWQVVRDENGNPLRGDDGFVTEEKEWPSLEVAVKAVGLFIEEQRIAREARA